MHAFQPLPDTESDTGTYSSPNTGTILLVDDEEPIRHLIREILERRGYRVLLAGDGPAALKVSSDFREEIHLLLTDIVMPRMNGLEVAKCLALQRPSIKILYMSGYLEAVAIEERTAPGRYFLRKPFLAQSLSRKVGEVLNDCAPMPIST